MRDTTIVLIDGLPGSGKSTTARFLTAQFQRAGLAAACWLEVAEQGQDHPLNVGGAMHPAGQTTGSRLFAHYSVASYIEESLQRWQDFVQACAGTADVQIVESYPYQNAARVLLQMDAGIDQIHSYAAAIEQVLQPLHPVLIYFEQQDFVAATRAIARQRGPAWTAYLAEVATDCPYARRLGLHGLDGVLSVMTAYKAMLDDLRAASGLPELVLRDCAGRWPACYQEILAFLQI